MAAMPAEISPGDGEKRVGKRLTVREDFAELMIQPFLTDLHTA